MQRRRNQEDILRRREEGFSLTGLNNIRRKEYNALNDTNMRHYFESENIQRFLYKSGQIDSNGRIIDLEKNKSKLSILEREFSEADKLEQKRQHEELHMRVSFFFSIFLIFFFFFYFSLFFLFISPFIFLPS